MKAGALPEGRVRRATGLVDSTWAGVRALADAIAPLSVSEDLFSLPKFAFAWLGHAAVGDWPNR
jgi:hypothetical protein